MDVNNFIGSTLLKQNTVLTIDTSGIRSQQIKELEVKVISLVDILLDKTAVSKGYKDIISACSYASVANSFQKESIQFITWRSAIWDSLFLTLQMYNTNITLALPNNSNDIINTLPTFDSFLVK